MLTTGMDYDKMHPTMKKFD